MTAVADLGLGTLDPELLGEAGAVARMASAYSPRGGLPGLRAAVADWLGLEAREVIVTTGASLALTSCFLALGPGRVLVPRPYYPPYRRTLELLGRDRGYYEVEGAGLGASLGAAATGEVAAVLVNTPGNPTGRVWSRSDMVAAAGAAADLGATLIVDETYRGLEATPDAWRGETLPCERVLRVGSMSKLFGLPGARVGYAAGPPELVAAVEEAHWAVAMSPPVVGQGLALSMLGRRDALTDRLRASLTANREHAIAGLRAAPGLEWVPPEGGIFLWVALRGDPVESRALVAACAAAGLVVMDGAAFGQSRPSVRCSFAVSPAVVEPAFTELARAISGLAGQPRSPSAQSRSAAATAGSVPARPTEQNSVTSPGS